MNNFKLALVMFKKIRPVMYDPIWIAAVKLAKILEKKTVSDRESKERYFCYLVDKIYEE